LGSSNVNVTAAPVATAPLPARMKSRRVHVLFFISLLSTCNEFAQQKNDWLRIIAQPERDPSGLIDMRLVRIAAGITQADNHL